MIMSRNVGEAAPWCRAAKPPLCRAFQVINLSQCARTKYQVYISIVSAPLRISLALTNIWGGHGSPTMFEFFVESIGEDFSPAKWKHKLRKTLIPRKKTKFSLSKIHKHRNIAQNQDKSWLGIIHGSLCIITFLTFNFVQ